MRRVKIAACLLVIIVIYSVTSLFILRFYNGQLRGRLESIQAAYESGDKSKALDLSYELNSYWHEYEKAVTMLVHDDQKCRLYITVSIRYMRRNLPCGTISCKRIVIFCNLTVT